MRLRCVFLSFEQDWFEVRFGMDREGDEGALREAFSQLTEGAEYEVTWRRAPRVFQYPVGGLAGKIAEEIAGRLKCGLPLGAG